MKLGLMDYVRAAFNARPIGMWIPPNWIGLGVFGFLGVLNPGFWVLGAGHLQHSRPRGRHPNLVQYGRRQ